MQKAIIFYKEYFTIDRGEFKEYHLSRPEGEDAYIGEIEITAAEGFGVDIYESTFNDLIISNGRKYPSPPPYCTGGDLYKYLSGDYFIEGLHFKTVKPVEKICQY